ncbi:hypothetical protein PROFUN_17050 [Planoprotostelium fungivorum]|uniref:Uncharacterized protein n=1 Tax=Planoprotostelium fungivorum TaxID=1890364 RepID=A0A2P6MMI7_9EUKA|nr:hypothetical protein PROFUN_17050 [Planoprotostelium fungivorum]
MAWLRAQKLDKTYDRDQLPIPSGLRDRTPRLATIYLCTDVQNDCHTPERNQINYRHHSVLFGNPLQNICKRLRALYLLYAVWVEIYTLKSYKRHNEAKGSCI